MMPTHAVSSSGDSHMMPTHATSSGGDSHMMPTHAASSGGDSHMMSPHVCSSGVGPARRHKSSVADEFEQLGHALGDGMDACGGGREGMGGGNEGGEIGEGLKPPPQMQQLTSGSA